MVLEARALRWLVGGDRARVGVGKRGRALTHTSGPSIFLIALVLIAAAVAAGIVLGIVLKQRRRPPATPKPPEPPSQVWS